MERIFYAGFEQPERPSVLSHKVQRILFIMGLFLIVTGLASCVSSESPSEPTSIESAPTEGSNQVLEVGGSERTYQINVPDSIPEEESIPLVLVLHGLGDNGKRMAEISDFSELAASEGFLVAYPNGNGGIWPGAFGIDPSGSSSDVEFIDALIDEIAASYPVDTQEVYISGFSNGAFFAFELACQLSEKVAAIGLVAGATTQQIVDNCSPDQPVSYIAIHGNADPVVPFEGGDVLTGISFAGSYVSAEAGAQFWAENNACDLEPSIEQPSSGFNEIRTTFNDCQDNTWVELREIEGGQHIWPGSSVDADAPGENTLEATEIIWNFFQGHMR